MNVGIVSPRVRKATKRRLAKEKLEKENKLENKTEEEIKVIVAGGHSARAKKEVEMGEV